jgi:hypothetical protein
MMKIFITGPQKTNEKLGFQNGSHKIFYRSEAEKKEALACA